MKIKITREQRKNESDSLIGDEKDKDNRTNQEGNKDYEVDHDQTDEEESEPSTEEDKQRDEK